MTITHHQSNRAGVLDVIGAICDRSVRALVTSVHEQLRAGHRIVVINLERVPSVDLSGLAGLLEVHAVIRDYGGQLRLAGVTGRIRDLLVVTRLLTVFDTFDSVEDALAGAPRAAAPAAPAAASRTKGLGLVQRIFRHGW